jgi:hypothetical protein
MKAKNIPQPRLVESTPLAERIVMEPSNVLPAVAIPLTNVNEAEDADARIRELAYRLYEERGRVDGYALLDWLEAEAIVRQRGKLAA